MIAVPTIVLISVLAIYITYYAIVMGANKKYREYVMHDNVGITVMVFFIMVSITILVAFGVQLTANSGDLNGGSVTYSWVLALSAITIASIFVASSTYTQVKLKAIPAGTQNKCEFVPLFVQPA